MKIYWFMIFWVSCWGIISSCYSKEVYIGNGRYEERSTFTWAFVTFSVIIFFIGLRSGVADTPTYIDMFDSYPTAYNEIRENFFNGDRDLGFKLLAIIIKKFVSTDFHIWLIFLAIVSGMFTMIPLQKYSCNYKVSVFLFMASCQFTWLLNGMRQYLAATIMFMCTGLMLRKKTFTYILVALIASTIHKTALILIPMYFIVNGEAWNKKTNMFMILIIIAILLADQFTNVLNAVVADTSYGEAMKSMQETDDGTNIIRIIVEAVPTIIAFIYKDKIKKKATPIINLSINMSVISTGLYIISKIAKSGIMLGRLPIYFSLYNLILLPWLIRNIFNKKERPFIYYSMIICYLLFFYYQMCIAWGGLDYISDVLNIYA